jgi:hypothetical protein
MKHALISPNEPVINFDGTTGCRVAEVADTTFLVASPLFWVDCEDYVKADEYYWDGSSIQPVPIPPIPPVPEPT